MRILLIHNYYIYRGGEDVYVDNLKQLLESGGHKVYLYKKQSTEISTSKLSQLQIGISLSTGLSDNSEIEGIIKSFQPDIAHVHNIYPLITPSIFYILKKNNIPCAQTIHNFRYLCPKGTLFRNGSICELCVKKLLPYDSFIYKCYHNSYSASLAIGLSMATHKIKKTFDGIDLFIFPSLFARDYHLSNSALPMKKTAVIPYFTQEPHNIRTKHYGKKYFLYVGRLSEEKGIIELLEHFKKLPEYNLVVIGDGPLKQKASEYAKYKNIDIKFFLPHRKIIKYISAALALIIPSNWFETGPIVLIEAYSQKRIVIAKAIGSIKEKIIPSNTGFFYTNYKDLKILLDSITTNPKMSTGMGNYAYNEYKKKYTPEVHSKLLQDSYSKILQYYD